MAMRFVWFNLMPWPDLPEDSREKYRSVWVDIPSALYDPVRGHEVYNTYLDQLEYAETVGYDGLGVNEHHANAYGLVPSPCLMAAALARRTSRTALVVLGSSIALYDPPILVGHSLGGMIAAEMAAVAPREVERLGLIAPAGLWLDQHPIPDLFSKLPHELPALLFHDPAFGERVMTAGADFDDPKFLETFIIRNTRQLAMAGKLLFPIPDRGLAERLYRIRAKTVLVWGESDRVIAPAYGDAFRRGIAGAELVRVPAAGHMVIVEQPEAVVAALTRLD